MANIKEQAAAVNMLPNARLTAAQVINSVFKDGAYANIALGKALSKQNHSEQDRRFVTELVYGTVKAKGTIDWLLQQLGHSYRSASCSCAFHLIDCCLQVVPVKSVIRIMAVLRPFHRRLDIVLRERAVQ